MTPINTIHDHLSMLLGFFLLMKITGLGELINVGNTGVCAAVGYYSVNNKYNLLRKSYKNYDTKQ